MRLLFIIEEPFWSVDFIHEAFTYHIWSCSSHIRLDVSMKVDQVSDSFFIDGFTFAN